MIFRNILGKVMSGLSNFSPVKNLIKYILDRSLNELLSNQISLQDFKNGELFLSNISLNLQKINRDYLLSSPYILHKGEVRKLKITLPSWSQLSTKSIEITAEGLHIDLKPNKQFADNFKEAMREQRTDIIQQEQPGGIDNPMDFFRQLVKQIILNMKIRVQNSVMRLFINQPTKQASAKPQYYLMFRSPLLTVGKSQDLVVKNKSQELQQIKFDVVIPQMSIHLLKENAEFPQYLNQKVAKEDFPFIYPPVNHPSTILLVGQTKNVAVVDKEKSTKVTITLATYFKKQKKITTIQGKINNFEAIINPIQLKIISRFFAQIIQFQKILKSVMAQMGLNKQVPLNMSRKDSKGKSGSYDLFSSIMMSIAQPASTSTQAGLLNNMMLAPQMKEAANLFNKSAAQQLRKSGEFQQQGWKNINFKNQLKMKFGLNLLQVNFLKYVTASFYQRKWSAQENYDKVNESLGCSHYRLLLKGLLYDFNSASNLHEVKIRFIKLQDARLKNLQSFHHSVSQQFYDIDSSMYENQNVNQDYFTKQPQLNSFKMTKQQHYCLEQLFRLSEGQDPQILSDKVKTYAFMPVGAQFGEGAGLSLTFNGDSKLFQVQIKDVAVMGNLQIWKDALNILYPVFLYRKLYERINLQAPQMKVLENGIPKNVQLFQSQYRFSGRLVQEVQSKEQKLQIKIKVGLVYCFYRETSVLKAKQNLLDEVQKKILDSDNFSKQCFCDLNQKGIYAQIHSLQWQQVSSQFNLSILQVKAGFLSVVNSKLEEGVRPILIGDRIRVEQIETKGAKNGECIIKNRTFLPKIRFVVQLPVLISFIDMTKKLVTVVDCLMNFKKSLSAKLLIIEQQLSNRSRSSKEKVKKERVLQCFVGQVQLKMLLLSTYLRGLFFRKKGGQQELKLDSIAIGLAKKLDIRIGQFRNQLITSQYPLSETYSGIKDTNLILQIGRQAKHKSWGFLSSEQKNKRKLQRKLQFFDSLQKETMSLWVIIKQKIDVGSQKKEQKAFTFNKARKNSVIQQQKKIKDISLLPLTCYVHAGNLAFLLLHKQQIQDIFKQVAMVLKQIQQQSKDIIQRRDSIQSQNEVTTQISLSLKDLHLNIDIKPDFEYNSLSGLRVLSNTRMFVNIHLPKVNIITNPDSQQTALDINFNINTYFLHYLDKDIETNPLLLNLKDLQELGFRKIIDLNEVSMKGDFNGKTNIGQFQGGIDSIKIDLCLTTIPYLKMFLDHFIQHSLAGNFGSEEQYDEGFIVLGDHLDKQDIPQDLTEKLEQYELLLNQKKKVFNQFSLREFNIKQSDTPRFSLKSFKVGIVKIRLFGGKQFKFIQCNSIHQSKASKRCRSQNPDLMNFISFNIENTKIKAEKNETSIQVFVDIERLGLQLSYKRREGLLWGADKDYTIHLLKINSPLKFVAQVSNEYLKIKLNTLQMTVSLTDQVFSLADQFSKASVQCDRSNWKRHYKVVDKVQQSKRMVLIILPQGRITASAQFKRTKLLNERILKLQQLLIHQQQSNTQRIMQLINDWAMKIFTSNLGTLVSGALFEILSTCIGLLLGGIKQILALFFPKLKD